MPSYRDWRTVAPMDASRLAALTLADDDGGGVALAGLWAQRPAALVFLRHYG